MVMPPGRRSQPGEADEVDLHVAVDGMPRLSVTVSMRRVGPPRSGL
jgi:hypothetical protein